MIGINIVCVGTLKEKYLREACDEYIKRLSRFCKLTLYEAAESNPEKEAADIIAHMKGFSIALCVEGTEISSTELCEKLEKLTMTSSVITFIIGSSEGLSEKVKSKADYRLSFSRMTFPHQLMRVIMLEQLYRAFTISNNITYHK